MYNNNREEKLKQFKKELTDDEKLKRKVDEIFNYFLDGKTAEKYQSWA